MLHLWGTARTLPSDLALTSALEFHRVQLERQRDLLRSVWWWYLLPFAPGVLVLEIGHALAQPERMVANHRVERRDVSHHGRRLRAEPARSRTDPAANRSTEGESMKRAITCAALIALASLQTSSLHARPPTVPSDADIRQILVDRIDRDRRSVGIVVASSMPGTPGTVVSSRLDQSRRATPDRSTATRCSRSGR